MSFDIMPIEPTPLAPVVDAGTDEVESVARSVLPIPGMGAGMPNPADVAKLIPGMGAGGFPGMPKLPGM